MNYIYTLEFLKKEANEIIGEWDGHTDLSTKEVRADVAKELLEAIAKVEALMKELNI